MAGNRMQGNFGKKEDTDSTAGQAAGDVKSRAQEAASNLGHAAQETASNVAQKAQEAASNLGQRAQDLASTAAHKTDDALTNVGEKMTSWAGSLRENAPSGVAGTAATAVADRLESSGRYLQEHGLNDMAEDLESVVRRYPIPSLLVGFGVGCLIGLAFSRR